MIETQGLVFAVRSLGPLPASVWSRLPTVSQKGISQCAPPSSAVYDHSKLAIPTLYIYSVIVDHPAMTSTEQQHQPLRMLSIGTVALCSSNPLVLIVELTLDHDRWWWGKRADRTPGSRTNLRIHQE